MTGLDLAAAAAALVGCRWRMHGRDPRTGLDCIGVLGAALAAIGRPALLPTGYPLRLRSLAGWLPQPAALGLEPAQGPLAAGGVVLLDPGGGQVHLAIAAAPSGWVHSHAGLRLVVHQPVLPSGPLLGRWRLIPLTQG